MITFTQFLLENKSKSKGKVIAYHLSNQLDHMLKADFRMEYSGEYSIFGKAIYFSSTPNIQYAPMNEGKKTYCCKFEITLEEPLLDMNREIPIFEANRLLKDFNEIMEDKNSNFSHKEGYNLQRYNFESEFDETVQMGEFFETIMNRGDYHLGIYFDFFIRKYLQYNSFQYFQNSFTDYIPERGDYGISYGVYDKKNIKFLDGPF